MRVPYSHQGHCTLASLLYALALANDYQLRQVHLWPKLPYVKLEKLARRIPVEDQDDFVDGELQQALAVCWRYRVWELHQFLNDVFNGVIPILEED